jgi:pimeloyl-ACP methyl ester carboxylesterase
MSKDVGTRQRHHYYFRQGTLDFYAGWLLGYGQLGGLAPGALYDTLNRIREGDPRSWVSNFTSALDYQEAAGTQALAAGQPSIAGQHFLAGAVAARAALNLADPGQPTAAHLVERMQACFTSAMAARGERLEPWNIPYGDAHLPAYVSTDLGRPVLIVVVGGGDTYREDLWFFGGGDALARGYAVMMADLPGQGSTPGQGLHFGPQTVEALDVAVRAVRERGFTGRTVLLGWSGGGLFATAYTAQYGGVDALIASTPILDIARAIEVALPGVLRSNPSGPLAGLATRLGAALNPVLSVTLARYDEQFGPGGIASMLGTLRALGTVDAAQVDIPLLALVGMSEDTELRRQAHEAFDSVVLRRPESRLVEFPPESGADAHCQVNNLPLALAHIFDWLGQIGLGP